MDFFPSRWAGGWGMDELMQANSKTVVVLHVGGDKFLARVGAGAGQDGGCLVVVH